MTGAGRFITFEGIEGSGKSTQIARLAERLRAAGHEVVTTREPGGTELGQAIRTLLLDPARSPGAIAELFLYLADRAENIRTIVEPALARGALVLADRHADATLAYQGVVRGLGLMRTRTLNEIATGGRVPDRTILLDLPVAEGLRRAGGREGGPDRMEREAVEFHERVRRAYLDLAAADPLRFVVIDASQPMDGVESAVRAAIDDTLERRSAS